MLTYSVKSEFNLPHDVGLKTYQRAFLKKHIPPWLSPSSVVLEIGGGVHTEILDHLNVREKWLADDFSGSGGGPQEIPLWTFRRKKIRVCLCLIGRHSRLLPANYFDCVFSSSTLEHVPRDIRQDLTDEIHRLLKPGGVTIHCIDAIVRCADGRRHNFDDMLDYRKCFENSGFRLLNPPRDSVSSQTVFQDPHAYFLEETVYNLYWRPHIKGNPEYKDFGRVYSLNMGFQKSTDGAGRHESPFFLPLFLNNLRLWKKYIGQQFSRR